MSATEKKLRKVLGSAYDGCVRPAGKKFYVDGIVYEIINGYWGYDSLYEKVWNIFTEWAESLGGEYFEFQTPSVLVVAE